MVSFPNITDYSTLIDVIPLTIFISIGILKELIEELKRKKYDKIINNQQTRRGKVATIDFKSLYTKKQKTKELPEKVEVHIKHKDDDSQEK